MTKKSDTTGAGTVLVYGATGHTGRLLVHKLMTMGIPVVLGGRSRPALEALARDLPQSAEIRVAAIEDTTGLDAICAGITTVINAAVSAKFKDAAVARAAVAAGSHYIDLIGDNGGVRSVFEQLGQTAADAGLALVPASGFFSVLSDLVISLAARDLPHVDDIDIAYWIHGWRPSGLAYSNFLELTGTPLIEFDHDPVTVERMPASRLVDFGEPIGPRRVVMWPGPEIYTLPRHVDAGRIRVSMTTSTLAPTLLGRFVPPIARILRFGLNHHTTAAATERMFALTSGGGHTPILHDPTTFAIVAHLRAGGTQRTATVRGSGIYTTTIPITTRIAAATLHPEFTGNGPSAAAEIVDAEPFLDGLRPHGIDYRITTAGPTVGAETRLRAPQPQ